MSKRTIVIFTGLVLACLMATLVSAQGDMAQPVFPQSFYGSIEAAGQPVPAGVIVEAKGAAVKTGILGNPIFSKEGGYGSPDPMGTRLEVQGELSPGDEITFFVGGVQAEVLDVKAGTGWVQVYTYSPGDATELNMRIAVPVTPVSGMTIVTHTGESTLMTTQVDTLPVGGVAPTPLMTSGMIIVLVILGGVAYYYGRKGKKKE